MQQEVRLNAWNYNTYTIHDYFDQYCKANETNLAQVREFRKCDKHKT